MVESHLSMRTANDAEGTVSYNEEGFFSCRFAEKQATEAHTTHFETNVLVTKTVRELFPGFVQTWSGLDTGKTFFRVNINRFPTT